MSAVYRNKSLVRPRDAEVDGLDERGLHRRVGKQRQCVAGYGAIVLSASDRVFERAVLGHQADGVFEVVVARLAALQRAAPEFALGVAAAAEGKHDRQRDFALAKIVADVLAELLRRSAVIENVVDELECDPKIHSERAASRLFGLFAS